MSIILDVLAVGAVDSAGAVLVSGQAYVYKVGTTTLATIYEDRECTIPVSNPVQLNAAGKAEVYALEEVRVLLEDADGVLVDDIESLGAVALETIDTTSDIPSLNIRRASARKPSYYSSTDTSQVVVPGTTTAPACVIIDGTLHVNYSNATMDLDASGRNGLDTGAKAANTPYYLYAIPSATASTGDDPLFDLIASVTAPTTGPTGFSSWSYVGAFCTRESAAEVYPFQSVNGYSRTDQTIETDSHTGDTTATAKVYASLPVTARVAVVRIRYDGTNTGAVYGRVAGTSTGNAGTTSYLGTSGSDLYMSVDCPIFTAQTLYLYTHHAGNTTFVDLRGWLENPMEYK